MKAIKKISLLKFKNISKIGNLEPISSNNKDNTPATMVIPLNKVTDLSKIIKEFCNSCIKSKYTKIIKYKKMTPTTCKLQKIHTNL